ncbi:hypothetical protein ACFQU9_48295 [Actinomadura namibiensis]|uniref:hypothetical protein n=1 Tax=Actinomadura kijaniata TaxID=46161 RepID=UPI003606C9D2
MSVPSDPPRFTPRVVRQCDLDWIKFDATVARDGSIDPVDKALYAALASFVDVEYRDSDPEAGEDDEDIPTRARLAECIGRSLDTVDRATKRLEERGIIRVHRRRDPNNPKRHLPSVYELLDHEWWDERAAARAEARRAAREQGRGGGRTGAARGSRIHAARGSRTSAAVPPSSKKISLSERAQREGEEASVPPPRASAEVDATEERENGSAVHTRAAEGLLACPGGPEDRPGVDRGHRAASGAGWRAEDRRTGGGTSRRRPQRRPFDPDSPLDGPAGLEGPRICPDRQGCASGELRALQGQA